MLARIADDLGSPVIITGDFNAAIEAPEMRALATGFDERSPRRAWRPAIPDARRAAHTASTTC